MVHRYFAYVSGILFAFQILSLHAAPMIEFDKTTYDCGIFTEGKNDIATAIFNVRNSGDSLLKIENVRPSCGCVIAGYDTFIPPGKSGKIKADARLSGYNGDFKKTVSITSNAKNQPVIQLVLRATIQPIIAVSKQYITLLPSKEQRQDSLYLVSLKKDLMVTAITFESPDQPDTKWHDQISLPITYEWKRTDSISSEGFTIFMLSLKRPDLKESISGEFKISTNHPDKRQLQIGGRIENSH